MNGISKHLTYANVVSSLALFLVVAGAGAVAASQLGKDSVGTKQLKRNSVTAAKIKDGAVTGAKVKLDTLGTVPSAARAASAARADTAARADSAARADLAARAESAATAERATRADTARSVDGQIPIFSRPSFGQTVTVAGHGSVSLVARCIRESGFDRVELRYRSEVNGALAGGGTDFHGVPPNSFLNAGQTGFLTGGNALTGQTRVVADGVEEDQPDGGFVLGPDDKGLVVNSDGLILALNYGRPGCFVAGVANTVG